MSEVSDQFSLNTNSTARQDPSGSYPYVGLPSVYEDAGYASIYITNINQKQSVKAVLLAIPYYILSVIMPIFSSFLFKGWKGIKGYGYPLFAKWLQMFGTVILLLIANVMVHYLQRKDLLEKSWIFGGQFIWKCKHMFFPSLCFAIVMSLTNVGIFLIDVNTHVLLRSSEIILTVLFAFLIQMEIPSIFTIGCCAALLAGTAFVSFDFTQNWGASAAALIINLASAVATGLMIVVLRRACLVLRETDQTITILEITLIKVGMATVMMLGPAFFLERNAIHSLIHAESDIILMVLAGVIITMTFQSITCGLAAFSLATTVGVISQSKVLPQIALAAVLTSSFSLTLMHMIGVVLIALGSLGYAILRYFALRSAPVLQTAQ